MPCQCQYVLTKPISRANPSTFKKLANSTANKESSFTCMRLICTRNRPLSSHLLFQPKVIRTNPERFFVLGRASPSASFWDSSIRYFKSLNRSQSLFFLPPFHPSVYLISFISRLVGTQWSDQLAENRVMEIKTAVAFTSFLFYGKAFIKLHLWRDETSPILVFKKDNPSRRCR